MLGQGCITQVEHLNNGVKALVMGNVDVNNAVDICIDI